MRTRAKKIIDIIEENFPNGVRKDYIDTGKILRLYSSAHEDKISRAFVNDFIQINGVEIGGRFYFVSDDDIKYLLRFFGEILDQHEIVYYSVLYRKHSDIFSRMNIFSTEVLKKILQINDGRHYHFEDFCSVSKSTRLESEVAQFFAATKKSLSLDDLFERLPFVPQEKILKAVSDTKKYLPTTTGKYLSAARLEFDLEEICAVKQKMLSQVTTESYVDFDACDLSSSIALNHEVAPKYLLNLIYERFFSDSFSRRGKKLFKKNDSCSGAWRNSLENDLRKILLQHDETGVKTLINYCEKIGDCSEDTMTTALTCALRFAVRVSEKIFVRDSLIKFDIAATDEALTLFVQGKIIPLRAVTSFSGFPSLGSYSWNLFMLESFLRRYSRRYRFATSSVNNSNVGAIYPKSMRFKNYSEVQVEAVRQEKLFLEKVSIKKFLTEQGYKLRNIDSVSEQIIASAQEFLKR